MKVLIVGYHFYPQNTPRSFRTYELVKELVKRQVYVDLLLPNKEVFIGVVTPIMRSKYLNIQYLGQNQSYHKPYLARSLKNNNYLRNVAKNVYRYFNPYSETKDYINYVYQHLKNCDVGYDLILAIAHPFSTLVGTAKAINRNPTLARCVVKVAEYSDPFTLQNTTKIFPIYREVDKWIARTFDYISVPTEKAISSYTKIKDPDYIKVIPQGFDFDPIELNHYSVNHVPSFGYAGVFYEKIRNPTALFEYLTSLKYDYRFYLYTSTTNEDTRRFLDKYQDSLRNKMVISYDVPRLDLIKQMSQLDFLLNIDNLSSNQVPSKIIDYALSGRPIYSFSQENFDAAELQRFIDGDYRNKLEVDTSIYDIKNVVDKLLNLFS